MSIFLNHILTQTREVKKTYIGFNYQFGKCNKEIAQESQVLKTVLKWSQFNPIFTKMFDGEVYTHSFDAFWGHLKILKAKRKAFSATASNTIWTGDSKLAGWLYHNHFLMVDHKASKIFTAPTIHFWQMVYDPFLVSPYTNVISCAHLALKCQCGWAKKKSEKPWRN